MKSTTATLTYTHVGYRPHTGYRHLGKLWDHYGPQEGKTHALNASGTGYPALCGEHVAAKYEDYFDGFERADHVQPAKDACGSGVTCARCRKALKLQKWAVQTVNLGGYWYSVKDHADYASKAEAEAALSQLRLCYPYHAFRVKMR